jgi:DNA-binding transcriptional LysR family regulator
MPLELQADQLVLLDVQGTPVVRTWHIIYRRSKKLSPATQAFKEFVIKHGPRFQQEKFHRLPASATRKTQA